MEQGRTEDGSKEGREGGKKNPETQGSKGMILQS